MHLHGAVWNEGPDKLCLVLEYVSGGSLYELLTTNPNSNKNGYSDPTFDAALWASPRFGLAHGIAKCFNYLHHGQLNREPVLHRDLKPANVLVDAEMNAKARCCYVLIVAGSFIREEPLCWSLSM